MLQNSLNLSPRLSATRRNDASAFHSPARQGSKSRVGSRAARLLSPLAQPAPARPISTPPVLPSFALNNEPLGDMGPFSKSEPLLPSSTDMGFMDVRFRIPESRVCSNAITGWLNNCPIIHYYNLLIINFFYCKK
jgi:hypothetical protein